MKLTVSGKLDILDKVKVSGGETIVINDLERAQARIKELEREVCELREKVDCLERRKVSGRQRHNEKWKAAYNDFVALYKNGLSVVEIAEKNGISERTVYRYKAYYDEMKGTMNGEG